MRQPAVALSTGAGLILTGAIEDAMGGQVALDGTCDQAPSHSGSALARPYLLLTGVPLQKTGRYDAKPDRQIMGQARNRALPGPGMKKVLSVAPLARGTA
ncbi:MAG: hypothetical protein ACREX1_14820 [Advenella sp.]